MAAFNERLKELNPAIRTTRESSARYMPYMGNNKGLDAQRDRTLKTADSVRAARLIPDRLMKSLFSDPEFVKREVKKPRKLMEQLLLQAAIMQDVDYLGISLYDLFTGEEIYAAWEDENFRRYVMFGPSKRFGDPIIADAKPLLRNIVETAEEVIGGGKELAASLRFGHDVNVIPLLALLGVEGASAVFRRPKRPPKCGRYTAFHPWRPTCSSSSSATLRATFWCASCTTSATPDCPSAAVPITAGKPSGITANRCTNNARLAARPERRQRKCADFARVRAFYFVVHLLGG